MRPPWRARELEASWEARPRAPARPPIYPFAPPAALSRQTGPSDGAAEPTPCASPVRSPRPCTGRQARVLPPRTVGDPRPPWLDLQQRSGLSPTCRALPAVALPPIAAVTAQTRLSDGQQSFCPLTQPGWPLSPCAAAGLALPRGRPRPSPSP